jgi:hypothetical protein
VGKVRCAVKRGLGKKRSEKDQVVKGKEAKEEGGKIEKEYEV